MAREALEQQAISALLSQSNDETEIKSSTPRQAEDSRQLSPPKSPSQRQVQSGEGTADGSPSQTKVADNQITPYQTSRGGTRESSRKKKKKDAAAGEKAAKVYRLTNQINYDTEMADGMS